MDFIKIRFVDDLDRIGSMVEKTVQDVFRSMSPLFALSESAWKPQVDIYETQEDVTIRAEIAGVDKDNLHVEICSKAVRIYGNRVEVPRVGNATYRLAEIQYGKFERILLLPSPVDTDIVSTSYSNGFLEIRFAKLQLDKTHKVAITED